jgi:hypothetical protein
MNPSYIEGMDSDERDVAGNMGKTNYSLSGKRTNDESLVCRAEPDGASVKILVVQSPEATKPSTCSCNLPPRDRHGIGTGKKARAERSRPVLDAYQAWLRQQKSRTMPKSLIG